MDVDLLHELYNNGTYYDKDNGWTYSLSNDVITVTTADALSEQFDLKELEDEAHELYKEKRRLPSGEYIYTPWAFELERAYIKGFVSSFIESYMHAYLKKLSE